MNFIFLDQEVFVREDGRQFGITDYFKAHPQAREIAETHGVFLADNRIIDNPGSIRLQYHPDAPQWKGFAPYTDIFAIPGTDAVCLRFNNHNGVSWCRIFINDGNGLPVK